MMNELALFAGAGGGILGGHLLGWSTVCAVECDAYAAQVLAQRQNDGILEPFPIWPDVRTFDGTLWRGIVDVVSGGFPCQDISAAGKCAGIEGERSGLWGEMARIISEVMPRFVFIENSSELISRGLDRVLKDLAEMGFNAKWGCIPAAGFGAPHFRNRAWIIAYANSSAGQELHQRSKQSEQQASHRHDFDGLGLSKHRARSAKTEFHRMDDALANRMDRLKAIGNGQVPRVAAAAFAMMAGQP